MNMRRPTLLVFDGYRKILNGEGTMPINEPNKLPITKAHLLWMINECDKKGKSMEFDVAKLSRWLGFVQANLINMGYITVEEERNKTRELFN